MTHTQSEDTMTGGWKTVKLGEIAQITKLAGFEFTKYVKYIPDGDIVAIRALNLKNGFLVLDDVKRISRNVSAALPRSQLCKNDIVVSYTGTIGECAQIREDSKYHLAPNVAKITPNPDVNPDYLFQYIRSKKFKKQMIGYCHGSTQPTIPMATIRELELSLPPLDVQRRIAAVLKPLDDKIELNARINERLERVAQALFKRHFVRFEPYGGTMPPGWRVGTVGEIITPKRGKNLLSKDAIAGDVPVVAGGLEPSVYHNTANTKAPVLTISGSGANAGFVRLWMRDVWSSDSSFIDSAMSKDVFFWYILLKSRQEEIYGAQTGSAQPHIYPKNIAEMKCIIPSAEAIREYCDLVSPMFEKIGLNTDESRTLARLRDVLLPRLMSGAVDVGQVYLNSIQEGGSR